MTDTPIGLVFHPTELGDFMIVAIPHDHYCDFTTYKCTSLSRGESGSFDVAEYPRNGANNSMETESDIADAQVFLSGSIKWDGCSSLNFDAQEDCTLHFCGREDAGRIGKLMDRLYELAAELIPGWDKELAA